jgi:hypothetical protein
MNSGMPAAYPHFANARSGIPRQFFLWELLTRNLTATHQDDLKSALWLWWLQRDLAWREGRKGAPVVSRDLRVPGGVLRQVPPVGWLAVVEGGSKRLAEAWSGIYSRAGEM